MKPPALFPKARRLDRIVLAEPARRLGLKSVPGIHDHFPKIRQVIHLQGRIAMRPGIRPRCDLLYGAKRHCARVRLDTTMFKPRVESNLVFCNGSLDRRWYLCAGGLYCS